MIMQAVQDLVGWLARAPDDEAAPDEAMARFGFGYLAARAGVPLGNIDAMWSRVLARAAPAAQWPAGGAPGLPEPLADVLVWRADDRLGESIGWDLGYWGTDCRWHTATDGGEVIHTPVAWWPLPLPQSTEAK